MSHTCRKNIPGSRMQAPSCVPRPQVEPHGPKEGPPTTPVTVETTVSWPERCHKHQPNSLVGCSLEHER